MNRTLLATIAFVSLAAAATAQVPPSGCACPPPGQVQPPGRVRGPSPLLYVRFNGTPGGRVTFYRGDQGGPREFEFPVTVGLRPGYIYRVKIDGLPGQTQPLFPTIEVRGSLYLMPQINPADFPAPFVLTETDVRHIFDGVLLTKVVYLEHPDRAIPSPTRPGELLERSLGPSDDLLDEARAYGRPMMVARVGERPTDTTELMRNAIPGTILLPTEKSLPQARVAPPVPFTCVPPYDPVLGPKPPEEECLPDGGDIGRKAAIGPGGILAGLDPSDTVAEYTDSKGRRHVMPSNRICVCVPRFAALRSELPIAGYQIRLTLANTEEALRQIQVGTLVPSLEKREYEQLVALRLKKRPSVVESETGLGRLVRVEVLEAMHVYQGPALGLCTKQVQQLTEVERTRLYRQIVLAQVLSQRTGLAALEQQKLTAVVGRVEGLGLYRAIVETADVACVCGEVPQLLVDKPLNLCKWADRQSAQVGDVVTFFLKYTNTGSKPIEDVAVSDSLTGRLEYIPGSAKTDRNAVFTIQENEAASAVLRWEISGKLLPGQHGLISFQARVR
jgi:uncharacterized repeat protein (TIGR01451 family)